MLDFGGNIYLADNGNNRIRRVDAGTGLISTVAGSGLPGFSGDSGPATAADLDSPSGMTMDGAGNLYFADELNNVIRRIDATSQIITTVAGTPRTRGYSGDNGPATSALLNRPLGISLDSQGNLVIADSGNNAIRLVDAVSGNIRTVAGTGTAGFSGDNQAATAAQLSGPSATLGLPDGTLLVSDTGNHRVRRVDLAGQITTVAGNGVPQFQGDGGPATAASLKAPGGLTLDPAGNLYIADSGNNRIRLIDVDSKQMSTIMGTDSEGFSGDDGPANLASMYNPSSVFFAQDGTLYLSDLFHMRIRAVVANKLSLTYPTIRRGKVSAPKPATLVNRGNSSLLLAPFVFNMSALDSNTTSCNQTAALASLATCQLGVQFAPTVIGSDVVGSLLLPSNAPSVTPAIRVDGEVLDVNPTSATVVSNKNPGILGDSITFTATITSDDTGRTGAVTITSDGTALCTTPLQSDGTANCSTSNLQLGSHAIVAHYAGDPQNAAANSAALTQVIKQSTTLQLTSSSNPVTVTAAVTFTINATTAAGIPTGTVVFTIDSAVVSTAVLNNGHASYSTSTLAPGSHNVSVQYGGDTGSAAGTSNGVAQVVQQAGTVTVLNVSNASPVVAKSITLSANVSTGSGPAPTGAVQFKDGSTVLGTAVVDGNGNASISTAALTTGSHSILAVYNGDVDDAASSSAPLTVSVQQIATAVTAVANNNPLSAGATLHLSSVVTAPDGSTAPGGITGTVTFREGATVFATVALDGSQGTATDIQNLSVGNHLLVATYSGNTNFAASNQTIALVVSQTAASISLSDAAGVTLAGKNSTWTAVVTSSTGIPSGVVTFRDGNSALGTATLNAQGVASFSSLSLPVGSWTMTAVYGGDANYNVATSAPLTHVVNLAQPALTLGGPAIPTVNVTTAVSFASNLSQPGVTPTGTLTLNDGPVVLATLAITTSGANTFSTSNLSLGQHSITATYSGDAYNSAATSSTVLITVQKAPTVTAVVSSPNPVTLGSPVTLSATVSAPTANLSGTIHFLDGTQVIGSAILSNGSASFTTTQLVFGHHALTAAYTGDDTHAASAALALDQSVRQQAVINIVSSLNPSNSGQNILYTATLSTVAGLLPTGSVTFSDGVTVLGTGVVDGSGRATLQTPSLSVGTHQVGVNFNGDANFSSASSSLTQTVQNSTSTTVETVSANPATYGKPLVLTATVTTNGGTATGLVAFTENGNPIGSAALGSTGIANFTTAALAPGLHSIVANYQTDGRANSSSSAAINFQVQQQTGLALTFDHNPTLTLSPVVISALLANSNAAPATGDILFFDGTSSLGTATLAGGTATLTLPLLQAGTHRITATYAGDVANFAATAPAVNEVVNLRNTVTSLTSSATNAADAQQVTLIAIVQSPTLAASGVPTGSITFSQGGQVLGTVAITNAGLATLNQELEVGAKESVIATYSGDLNYSASASSTINVQGGLPANFTISLSSLQVQLQSGQHQMLDLTLTSLKGFNDSIRLGCAGLPYAATCTFTKTSVGLAANGVQSMQLMVDTGDPLGEGSATASIQRRGSSTMPLLCLLPTGLLLFLCRKSRMLPVLAGVLLLSAITLGNSGCSGLRMSSTPPGTYTFQVTGVGVGSGAKQTQTVTLTVGK
ncbi:MAG: Ig-like domain repeat protein [Janthinobacterium lividum]